MGFKGSGLMRTVMRPSPKRIAWVKGSGLKAEDRELKSFVLLFPHPFGFVVVLEWWS